MDSPTFSYTRALLRAIAHMDWNNCTYEQSISDLLREKKMSPKEAAEINYHRPSVHSFKLLRAYIDLAPFARNPAQFLLMIADRMGLKSTRDMELIKNLEKFKFDGGVALFLAASELLERVDARMLPKNLKSDDLLAHEKDKRELIMTMLLDYDWHGPRFDLIEYVKSFGEVLCDPTRFKLPTYEVVNKQDVVDYLFQYFSREANDREFDSDEMRDAWIESQSSDAYTKYNRLMLTPIRLESFDQHRKDVLLFKVNTVLVDMWKQHIRNLPTVDTFANSIVAMIKAGRPIGYVRAGACLSCTWDTPEAHPLKGLCKHNTYHQKHDACPNCMTYSSPHQISMCKLTRCMFKRAPFRPNWSDWEPRFDTQQELKSSKSPYSKSKGKDTSNRYTRSSRPGRDSYDQTSGGNGSNSNDNIELTSKGSESQKSDRTKVKPKKEEKRS